MTRKNLSFTIAVGFLALLGIIAIQVHWIRTAYLQNKISFEHNLNKALNQVVLDLSRQENIFFGLGDFENVRVVNGSTSIVHFNSDSGKQMVWEENNEKELISDEPERNNSKFIVKKTTRSKPGNNRIIIRSIDNDVELVQEFHLDSLTDQIQIEHELKSSAFKLIKKDSLLKKYEARIDSVRKLLDYNILTITTEKEELNKTMVELFMDIKSVTHPFADRIPIKKLQKSIEYALEQYDLPKNYAFAIMGENKEDFKFKTDNFDTTNLSSAYSIRLFPHSLFPRPDFLYLSFQDSNPLFKQMLWPISLAFIFTLLLLTSLLVIINNLLHHKKLSALKTDFINNMTHEFKTPIATIQLATDSVMNLQILNNPEKISYFMRLIKAENKRMNLLVERILQMAQMEKKSFSLIKTDVEMHPLIDAVAENSQLKIEQAGGTIKLSLKAEQSVISVDEMHLTNVLFNLIDNAIKYRSEHLLIEISTSIRNKQFVIAISDNGQGMTAETIAHIFDKFFRLTEGDVHTVKGYGLGLSYVKAIIDRHQGQIQVHSEPQKGSRFEISLPLKH